MRIETSAFLLMISLAVPTLAQAPACDDPVAPVAFRRIFVSSVTGNGDFDTWPHATVGLHGLAAADSICQKLAVAAGLPNSTAYRAWLSDSDDDAWCRIQNLSGRKPICETLPPPQGAGPWARADGDLAATGSLAELTGLEWVFLPIWIDETGTPISGTFTAWTGTDQTGAADRLSGLEDDFCGGWDDAESGTALMGDTRYLGRSWTKSTSAACTGAGHILCLEAATGPAPPRAGAVPGGILFVSGSQGSGDFSSWSLAGGQSGTAAADTVCQAEAAAEGLPAPSGFKALAWDGTTTPLARFPDIPWNRPDTYRIADSTTLFASAHLRTAPNQTAAGTYLPAPFFFGLPGVWTGLTQTGGASPNNCTGWTSTTGNGLTGQPHAASVIAYSAMTYSCDNTFPRILCASDREYLFWESFEYQTFERWSAVVGAL